MADLGLDPNMQSLQAGGLWGPYDTIPEPMSGQLQQDEVPHGGADGE